MKIIDPGHVYDLDCLDGELPVRLTFVKREGAGYPGNVGHHPGANIQEVLRALIDRVRYLDEQVPCGENLVVLDHFRDSIFLLERRAARRHGRRVEFGIDNIETQPTCAKCGHIGCTEESASKGSQG